MTERLGTLPAMPVAEGRRGGASPGAGVRRSGPALFRDPDVEQRLDGAGVALVRGAVPLDAVVELRRVYDEAMARYHEPTPEHWFPTGMLADPDLQARMHDGTHRIATEVLGSLLLPGRGCVFTGSFAVKPVGPASYLGPHQDVSLVDETESRSVNFWIPLERSTPDNGALTFVAGSHRFGNVHRSLALPWAFEGLHEVMEAHAQMVLAEAGDLILFDTAVIHGSPANRTDRPRVALQGAVVPVDEEMEHLSVGPDTPPGMVEVRRTSGLEQLVGDGVRPPAAAAPVLRALVVPTPSREEFEAWCRVGAAHRLR